jgi:DNA processing protein
MNVEDPLRAALDAAGADILSISDDRYPPLLREIHDPPPLLYVRGDVELLRQPQLAMVGSRRATAAGLRAAQDFAGAVARAGLHICSGLALGIDGAAHRGALSAGGKTVAVMATGVEAIYPRRHQDLGEDILASGCLVTEFPPGTPPRRENFPQRNRIISGMSLGTLVVEAALPSGSLITANAALEQGREVFALPWSVAHQGGAGCLKLLRDGAKMVTGVEDILEELGALYGLQLDMLRELEPEQPAGKIRAKGLLAMVGYEAVSVDTLVATSGMPVARVMSELSRLEMQGAVVRCPGGYVRV